MHNGLSRERINNIHFMIVRHLVSIDTSLEQSFYFIQENNIALARNKASQRLQEVGSKTSNGIAHALSNFQAIRNPALSWTLKVLPFAVLALAVGALNADDPMFATGLAAAALSLFAFGSLMKRIPYTFRALWNRNIIAERTNAPSVEKLADEISSETTKSPSASLEKGYSAFVLESQEILNKSAQWAMGLLFALIVFAWEPKRPMDFLTGHWDIIAMVQIAEHFIAFIIGLMAWRMLVIGILVWKLGKRFDLNPQLGHPDTCGGLEPLGTLCLWNALILALPGAFLGGWIILGPSTRYDDIYTSLFYKLLLVPVSWAAISFFLPLWSVHEILLSKRETIRLQLDQLSRCIDKLTHRMLDHAHELEPEESEKTAKKLELMQQTYQQNKDYPVWPFNYEILKKLALSQTVQVLSLTGLGKPILDAVKIVVDLLNGLSKP